MTDRELMQQALEALLEVYLSARSARHYEAITALRERLAQHEALDQLIADSQSMGAYSLDQVKAVLRQDDPQFDDRMQQARERLPMVEIEPVLTVQPERSMRVEGPMHVVCQCDKCKAQPEQEPVCAHGVGKTKCDFCRVEDKHPEQYPLDRMAENAREQPGHLPEQEPVAWWHDMGGVVDLNVSGHGRPLYFAPPRQWVGLTDEEVEATFWPWKQRTEYSIPLFEYRVIAQAIEAKLKEKNA